MQKDEKDWFKLKRYPHIGFPIKYSDRYKWVEKYVTDPENIAQHSFLPFIHRTSKVRKFRKEYSQTDGTLVKSIVSNREENRKSKTKERELFYASHLDSLIYSYYTKILSDKYEEKVESTSLNEVVNAYRSVPVDSQKPQGPNKCNIDFANDVFKFLLSYKEDEFVVLGFDIKSFFDNLDHRKLRDAWMKVLGVPKLSEDHFNVFKSITRYKYIDIVDLFEQFKDKIFIQKKGKIGQLLPLKRKKVARIKFMRNQEAIAFCTKAEFLN